MACIGAVKAAGVHPKSAAQHARDLLAVEQHMPEKFIIEGGKRPVEILQVDGGPDEGPRNKEVQFYHAVRFSDRGLEVMIVMARYSGGRASYLFPFQPNLRHIVPQATRNTPT